MINGSCCCGAVTFAITGAPSMMGKCHCSRCRKAGSSTLIFVRKQDLVWLQGRETVVTWRPEPPHAHPRSFCRICGSSLGEITSEAESFPISVSALDSDPGLRVQFHVFTADKPAWEEICDNAPQFTGMPPS